MNQAIQRLRLPHDRSERLHYVRHTFPQAAGPDLADEWQGGRVRALQRLSAVDAVAYERNRNFLNGAVTGLSPYLRHGCLTLDEAFASVKGRFGDQAQKLLFEFAWRDYWRRVWALHGDAIFADMEAPKVPLGREPLPEDIRRGETGLPCMDAFIADLLERGYLHNHARMWFAAYVLHWRKVDWRAAADWYLANLLDGDKASNHLSWQWVASTFASKPYYFNKENLARYTGEKYCSSCRADCPFNDSYEGLQAKLFAAGSLDASEGKDELPPKFEIVKQRAIAVFVHDEMLSPANPLLRQVLPKVFVFDPQLHGDWSLKRLQFVADCLSEMDEVEVWVGDTQAVLESRGIGNVLSQATPDRNLQRILMPFVPRWHAEPPLVNVAVSEKRLKRFSRYWDKVGPLLLGDSAYRQP